LLVIVGTIVLGLVVGYTLGTATAQLAPPVTFASASPVLTDTAVPSPTPVQALAGAAEPTAMLGPSATAVVAVPTAVAPTSTPATPATTTPVVDERVDRAMAELTSDSDLVGQLLLLGWAGDTAGQARQTVNELHPAGMVFVDNTKSSVTATDINRGLVGIASDAGVVPLFLAVDHEGGLVQRFTDIPNLGSNASFAASNPTETDACERGHVHAQQLLAMGFNMNLAPVLDVNNNPNNPVIGTRSYGPDPELVARLGAAYVRGLQGHGIIAVGKHFPGHGNTDVDSHLGLPILNLPLDELEQVELVPFRRAIQPETNIAAIMSAHIVFPAVDPSGVPATLSMPVMTGLLRERLGFGGLTLSDDLAGMKAITDNYTPGDAAVRAVRAGVDLLIIAGGLSRQRESRDALVAALASGDLPRAQVQEAVRHVLTTKARFGLLGDPAPTSQECT
jgi:beta-N-acetylhexosaminidase